MLTLYEFNQQAYETMPIYTEEQLKNREKDIKNFIKNNPSNYYMLLNNDLRYYTLFTFKNGYKFADLAKELVDLIQELGGIKDIEIEEDKIGFWIYDLETNKTHVFYFFDYRNGVIEIE